MHEDFQLAHFGLFDLCSEADSLNEKSWASRRELTLKLVAFGVRHGGVQETSATRG